jgi:hypothetical protein
LQTQADVGEHDFRAMLIDKLSKYSPEFEIPVMVTDGISRRYSVGVRRA